MEEAEKFVRNIFSTGKLIRDRIFSVKSRHLLKKGARERFGDLSIPQLDAVKLIRIKEKVSMKELSELLMVSPPSASAMVDRLVVKGVLTREPSAEDRRKVVIQVAQEAIEDIKEVEKAILNSFIELMEKIGPKTGKKWCDVLEQVNRVLEEERLSL